MVLERRGDCSLILAKVMVGRKREEEEEGKRKKITRRKFRFGSLEHLFCLEVWNSCLEISYSCLELWFGNFVWIYWLGNYPHSFFVYVL